MDNGRIITMEWIIEGVSLFFLGVFVATVTAIDPLNTVSKAVYIVSILNLLVLATVSLFTGFRVNLIPFKLCPFIFLLSAALIFVGGLV